MPHRPARIEFAALPQSRALEAAARRRMQAIEDAYPCVVDWHARIEAPPHEWQGKRFAAAVRARIVGGRALLGDGLGPDALGALRQAFNALEIALEEDQASARARAAAWLAAVRDRMRGFPEFR